MSNKPKKLTLDLDEDADDVIVNLPCEGCEEEYPEDQLTSYHKKLLCKSCLKIAKEESSQRSISRSNQTAQPVLDLANFITLLQTLLQKIDGLNTYQIQLDDLRREIMLMKELTNKVMPPSTNPISHTEDIKGIIRGATLKKMIDENNLLYGWTYEIAYFHNMKRVEKLIADFLASCPSNDPRKQTVRRWGMIMNRIARDGFLTHQTITEEMCEFILRQFQSANPSTK